MKKAFVIAMFLVSIQLQAQMRIGANEALTTAENFITQNTKQGAATLTLSEEIKSKQTEQTNLFVFLVEPQRFVIVSANNEVLAYSLTSPLPKKDDLPDHIVYWLDHYNQITDYLIAHPETRQQQTKYDQEVGPLTTSRWGQGCYYNEACPVDSAGLCHHASAGCVAIAMAQILYYHKSPLIGNGEISYSCNPYGILGTNFGETTYLWEAMTDTLHGSNLAVAQLIYHCGLAVKMQYGTHQSSSTFTAANTAFRQYFNYPSTMLCYRINYDNETWKDIIKHDLDRGLPVYYRGISSIGGHAFVCDGYDPNGLFHFNFGWDGNANGYFSLDNPSGFSSQQGIIHDIQPISNIPIHSDEHNIIYVTPDGTGDGTSWAAATDDLQGALFRSHLDGSVIWVKEGIYKGESVDGYAFRLMRNSKIYGGFKGDEPFDYDLSLRNFEAHPSILDGDHRLGVVTVLPYLGSDNIVIDGLTIQNGKADEGAGHLVTSNTTVSNCKICYNNATDNGGGLATMPNSLNITINNCEFFGNESKNGGAIQEYGGTTLNLCNIHDNVASISGGGIHDISGIKPSVFVNCKISNNSASIGGGMHSSQARTTLWNCLINNNTAQKGGGCYGEPNLFNCTIVKNEGLEDFGGIYNTQTIPHEIKNCIIWGNVSAGEVRQIGPVMDYTYCAVQDKTPTSPTNIALAIENAGETPECYVRFVDANVEAGCENHGGDWRLQSQSTCIDRGDTIAQQPFTDLEGNPRLRHKSPDLGAYETDIVSHIIDLDFCETAPYYYDGTYISMPGTYTFLYPGASYDSLVILNMNSEIVWLSGEICETETYEFFGETLNEPGHYSTLIDCIEYQLDLIVNPLAEGDFTEVTICEGDTYDFNGKPLSESGHYTDTIGCTLHRLELTVKPMPVITMEESLCEGQKYNFFGTLLGESGHYYKEIHCSGHYHLDLNVLPKPVLQCSNDTTITAGYPAILDASGANSYLWSTGDTTARIIVYPEKDRYYFVTGTSENGCSSSEQIKIKVVEENKNEEICMFPNPANEVVNIYKKNIDEVVVFNLLGEPIAHINAHRENTVLDVSKFADGIYIVMTRVLSHRYYTKLTVRH